MINQTFDIFESDQTLRVLTIRQPWASLCAQGVKDVENRSWPTSHRGLLVIHAGLRSDAHAPAWALSCAPAPSEQPRGVLVGVVRLVDCVQGYQSRWAEPDAWHWVLEDARELDEPIPHRGALGLGTLHPNTARAVLRRV